MLGINAFFYKAVVINSRICIKKIIKHGIDLTIPQIYHPIVPNLVVTEIQLCYFYNYCFQYNLVHHY